MIVALCFFPTNHQRTIIFPCSNRISILHMWFLPPPSSVQSYLCLSYYLSINLTQHNSPPLVYHALPIPSYSILTPRQTLSTFCVSPLPFYAISIHYHKQIICVILTIPAGVMVDLNSVGKYDLNGFS